MPDSEISEAEKVRQVEVAKALARLKHALERAVGRVFPLATEPQCTALAVNIFLCMDDAGIGMYLKDSGNEELECALQTSQALLAETQRQLSEYIADFCTLRDALPRKLVEQILSNRSQR
jgi:hypothetical protein